MENKISEKIEYLRKRLEDEIALQQKVKDQQTHIQKLNQVKKDNPEQKKELDDVKRGFAENKKELKRLRKEIGWFATQLGGRSGIRWGAVFAIVVAAFILGIAVGSNFSGGLPGINFKKKSSVDNLIMCEYVYGGQPANPNTIFEVGKTKTLTCYAVISPKENQTNYFIEWIYNGAVQGSTPLLVNADRKPVLVQRDFSVEDIGKWEAHLKTRDGNTWGMVNFSLVYPKLEIKQAVICEDVVNERPDSPGSIFISKDRTLYCYSETKSNEQYAELIHEWFYNDKLILKKKIPLNSPISYKWSLLDLRKNQTGDWHVNIISGDGSVLKRLDFKVEDRHISVPYAELYANNDDGNPDNILTNYQTNGKPVYFFTRVLSNFSNYQIKHEWYFQDKKVMEKKFDIDSLGAKISSSRVFFKKQTGKWTLKVVDVSGHELFRKEIKVEKPITDLIKINRLVFCRTIFDKDPYDISSKFSINDNTKIWAWASVNNQKGLTSVTFEWLYGEKFIKSHAIGNISKSSSYRIYDYKTVMPGQKGKWSVKMYAEDGSLLKKSTFIVN